MQRDQEKTKKKDNKIIPQMRKISVVVALFLLLQIINYSTVTIGS